MNLGGGEARHGKSEGPSASHNLEGPCVSLQSLLRKRGWLARSRVPAFGAWVCRSGPDDIKGENSLLTAKLPHEKTREDPRHEPPHQLLETGREKRPVAAREQASTPAAGPPAHQGKSRMTTVRAPQPAAARARVSDASDGSEPADAASLPRGATSFLGFVAQTKQKSSKTQPATRRVSQRRRGTDRHTFQVSETGEMTSPHVVWTAQRARESIPSSRQPPAPTPRTW